MSETEKRFMISCGALFRSWYSALFYKATLSPTDNLVAAGSLFASVGVLTNAVSGSFQGYLSQLLQEYLIPSIEF